MKIETSDSSSDYVLYLERKFIQLIYDCTLCSKCTFDCDNQKGINPAMPNSKTNRLLRELLTTYIKQCDEARKKIRLNGHLKDLLIQKGYLTESEMK